MVFNTGTSGGGMSPACMGNPPMDLLSLMIYIAIGNMVGWLAALYVKGALPGLIGHVIVSTLGAAALLYVTRLRNLG